MALFCVFNQLFLQVAKKGKTGNDNVFMLIVTTFGKLNKKRKIRHNENGEKERVINP